MFEFLLQVDSTAVAEDKGLLSAHYDMLTIVIIVIVVVGLFVILRGIRKNKSKSNS